MKIRTSTVWPIVALIATLLLVAWMGTAHAQDVNTSYGNGALANTTGNANSAFGDSALNADAAGSGNTAHGFQALASNTTGILNVAVGSQGMSGNTTGFYNTGLGSQSLQSNTTGNYNSAVGYEAGYGTTSGSYNNSMGFRSGYYNQTGSFNINLGHTAGYYPVSGSYNIEIGNMGLVNDDHWIRIGTQGTHRGANIAGIYGTLIKGGQNVVVNSKGQLGVSSTTPMATQADVLTLRQQLAAAQNMIFDLQRQVAALQAKH